MLARGIRWRLMGSLLIVITAAIAVGTAIVGPLFLRAGGDSLVRRGVATANPRNTALGLVPVPGRHPVTLNGLLAERRALLARGHLTRLYGPSVESMSATLNVTSPAGHQYASRLTYRSGMCLIVHFRAGGCRASPRDAIVSDRTAKLLGLSIGSAVTISDLDFRGPVRMRITGVFRMPDLQSAYWSGDAAPYFPFGKGTGKPRLLLQIDDLFAARPAAFATPPIVRPTYVALPALQTQLRPGVLDIGNASAVSQALVALQRHALETGFTLETGLPALLSNILHQQSLMDTIVAVAALQLVLLAIWVLTSVLLRSADLRRGELRVARLRGFPPRTLVAVSITEPAALCALGAVLGIAGAWVVVRIAASILFAPGTTVRPDRWTFVCFAAVLLTICAVLGLSAMRLLRGSGVGASSPQSARSRSRVVVDVSILAVSVVALIGALTSGALSSHSNPIAAAAPAIVALGTSVIAIRIVEYACRRLSTVTRDSSAVASSLAVRRIGRRPTVLREGRTVVIAVGLACFAVCAWSVARANRATAARFSIGAPTVVTVTASNEQLDRAVHAVDPRGRFAMAAAQISTSSTDLMAVDAARLPVVGAWPEGTTRASVAAVSRALTPKKVFEVPLANGALAVSAKVSAAGAASRDLARLHLQVWMFDSVEGDRLVDLGALRAGRSTYQAGPQPHCPCRLTGIGVLPGGKRVPPSGQVHLDLHALSYRSASGARHSARAELTAAAWHSSVGGVRVVARPSGVAFDIPISSVKSDLGPFAEGAQASIVGPPSVLPAVGDSRAQQLAVDGGQDGTLPAQGLDGSSITVRPVIGAASLPRLGSGGVFVDLGTLERTQTFPTFEDATPQVWLGPRAPANAVSRLRAAGLQIDGVQRSTALISRARHSGPSLAYDFMLLATLVALLVAAVGTFSVLAAGGRQRATELVALEVTGVKRSILARSLAIESAILALTALFGVAAGVISAAVVLPSLPQLSVDSDAPLSYALPAGLILAVALGAVLVVALATAVAARGILTRMSPSLLRTAPDDVD